MSDESVTTERAIETELRRLVHERCEPAAVLGLEQDLVRELGLDSLAALRLLAAVEKRFGARFPDERLAEFRTMGRILGFLAEEGVKP